MSDHEQTDAPELLLNRVTDSVCWLMRGLMCLVMLFCLLFTIVLFASAIWSVCEDVWHWLFFGAVITSMPFSLRFLESLFLAPLPFLVGTQLFHWALDLGEEPDELVPGRGGLPSQRHGIATFAQAKGVVISLMISVLGVNMVESILVGKASLAYCISVCVALLALTAFYWVLHVGESH